MSKKKCSYYPCHNMLDLDCKWCFCPIYACYNDKLGDYVYDNGEIVKGKDGKPLWDCSDCTLFHDKKNADRLQKLIGLKGVKNGSH